MREVAAREEAVRLVLAELGDAPAAEVAALVESRYGFKIDARYVPVFRATFLARERLEEARALARALTTDLVTGPRAERT